MQDILYSFKYQQFDVYVNLIRCFVKRKKSQSPNFYHDKCSEDKQKIKQSLIGIPVPICKN